MLISCTFNYEAKSTEFDKLGPIPVLKARMNTDLHMQQDLANSGKGNLFVIFGEPDIDILDAPDHQIQVKINGSDISIPYIGLAARSTSTDFLGRFTLYSCLYCEIAKQAGRLLLQISFSPWPMSQTLELHRQRICERRTSLFF